MLLTGIFVLMFTQPDPANLAGGINLYLYGHNPLGWVDSLGLEVYELRAGKDGTYDVYEWGTRIQWGKSILKREMSGKLVRQVITGRELMVQ